MSAYIKALFASTIFTSAFLLFLVQPIIAKQILPWFGGSATVWSICMVFFQVVLLLGYMYSDWTTRRLGVRAQTWLHVGLLLASLAFLPIITSTLWKPTGDESPTLWILGLLAGTIGLPYFLLSTTGPLVQSWVTRTAWSAQVYRYFALSNFASLASLLSYPVLIEPHSTLIQQATIWSAAYGVFVVLCIGTTLYVWRCVPMPAPVQITSNGNGIGTTTATGMPAARPGVYHYLVWAALPALGSWLLLAVTNHITQNVAAIPFLWVVPLSVYLLTFVLAFESDKWYRRQVFLPLAAVMLVLCAFGLQDDIGFNVKTALPVYIVGLFAFCMFLHGEMARLRPGAAYLTRFYLMLSLGGALGGISVGLVAPHVLSGYYELGLGLVLCALVAAVLWRHQRSGLVFSLSLAACCAWFLAQQVQADTTGARRMERNFYGTLQTLDTKGASAEDRVRQLYHGSVKHGEQYLAAARRQEATTYYGSTSGIGRAIAAAPSGPRRVGLIGLGAGTLAVYGRPGDIYRTYEINPLVFKLADEEFSFLPGSLAHIDRVPGDARLAMEREASQQFDVLAVDAFSGDSVPVHLITTEAMDVYLRHMQPNGVIAFHVTNRFLALAPVVERIASARGLHSALIHDEAENSDLRRTDWVLVSRDPQALAREPIRAAISVSKPIAGLVPWTDDFSNLFGVLK